MFGLTHHPCVLHIEVRPWGQNLGNRGFQGAVLFLGEVTALHSCWIICAEGGRRGHLAFAKGCISLS